MREWLIILLVQLPLIGGLIGLLMVARVEERKNELEADEAVEWTKNFLSGGESNEDRATTQV